MRMRRKFGWIVLVCGLFCGALPAWGQVSAWEAGIAKVITHGTKAPGTAFVVALRDQSAWLVTSAHVVQGDAAPEVEFRVSPDDPKHATVRYPQFDSSYGDRGLAILVVANPPAGARVLPGTNTDVAVLDQVVVVGYPASNNGMFTAAKTDAGSVDSAEIVVNSYTDDGFSGGPVLRENAVSGMIFGQRPGKGVALTTAMIQAYLKGKVTWEEQAARRGSPDASAESLFAAGQKSYELGDYQTAITKLTQALSLRTSWAEAFNLRAASYDKLEQLDAAFRDYDQAVKLASAWSSPIFYRGRIYERRGDLGAAAADYDQAIRLTPNWSSPYYSRAVVFEKQGQPTRAYEYYAKACALSPDWGDACASRDRLRP